MALWAVHTWPENTTKEKIECEYYPTDSSSLYEMEVGRWEITVEDVWSFFNLEDDDEQYIDWYSKEQGRQLRLERLITKKKWLFSIPRYSYIVSWVPWVPWPPGRDGKDWNDGRPGRDWKNGKDGRKWKDGSNWKQWLKGDPGRPGSPGRDWNDGKTWRQWKQWNPGKDWRPGKDWISFIWEWQWNSGKRYEPNNVVHHEWSARIAIETNINKEPGVDRERDIFVKWV